MEISKKMIEFFFKYNVYYNFSENEILSILEQQCKFFENIIETIKPDFVIFQ